MAFFSQWPDFSTGLAGKFCQELATLNSRRRKAFCILHHKSVANVITVRKVRRTTLMLEFTKIVNDTIRNETFSTL